MVSPKRNPVLNYALAPLKYDQLRAGKSPRYRIPGYNTPEASRENLVAATQLNEYELGTPRENFKQKLAEN